MRIAYVAGAAMPSAKASTIHVMMMCQAMARLGHEVTLFTPSHQARPGDGPPGSVVPEPSTRREYD